ncbi:MAG: ABC transporter substrate-binding protein [Candidatus Rokubacteria bacterium]|nr:ABC transporter substrate-binding protein [Candidatus Rokubacteria bacterium]
MRLARLVALAALVLATSAADAQTPPKIARVGFLGISTAVEGKDVAVLRQRLAELGYVEGRNLVFEYRSMEGKPERVPALARELVQLKVDVIATVGNEGTSAAKKATQTIPIVMVVSGDPVRMGFAASLARPGGNITGLSNVAEGTSAKGVDLLKAALPQLTRAAVLYAADAASNVIYWKEVESTARRLGVTARVYNVRSAADIGRAFPALVRDRAEALIVLPHAVTNSNQAQIVRLAATHRLPAMYPYRSFAEQGGLLSYGPDRTDMYRRAATYIDRILKGARPAELPIDQPTSFEFVVNAKTVKALGLTIPQSVLGRADLVIQ